jgi:hypothetical protein
MLIDQQPLTMQPGNDDLPPGYLWSEIIRRPTLEEFSAAFTANVTLDASVLPGTIRGAPDVRAFFDTTRGMYDTIAFTWEENGASRTYLEWEGEFAGRLVTGVTILSKDAAGSIESIRLFHSPLFLVNDFSADLLRRLAGKMMADVLRPDPRPINTSSLNRRQLEGDQCVRGLSKTESK